MKKSPKLGWVVAVMIVLLLTVLTVACSSAPATEDATTEDTAKEEVTEEDTAKDEVTEDDTTKDETTKEEVTDEDNHDDEDNHGAAPVIAHATEGQEDCLLCHSESGFKPFPADHAGRTNDICTTCHEQAQ